MSNKSFWLCVGAGVLSATLLPLVGSAQSVVPLRVQQAEAPASKYWIGIGLGELNEIVKEQLGLEHGLVVDDVMPDSPALAAGFKKNDILVKVGDKALQGPAELVAAVEEAQETELAIGVLRGGKETTIKVTPTKRPEPTYEARVIELPQGAGGELRDEIKRLEEALNMLKDKAGKEGLGIVFARPGVVAQNIDALKRDEFPKELSISVHKEGDKPAEIHVKQGDKEWKVTEDKMGELPDDVRPHVHHFFGRLWGPGIREMGMRSLVGGPKLAPGVARVPSVRPPVPAPQSVPVDPPVAAPRTTRSYQYRLESRGSDDKLDEIMKELKALRKEVDELRGKPSEEKK
jgi:membrane-associated protease RseP (regulator of RpoE activity)